MLCLGRTLGFPSLGAPDHWANVRRTRSAPDMSATDQLANHQRLGARAPSNSQLAARLSPRITLLRRA